MNESNKSSELQIKNRYSEPLAEPFNVSLKYL
jgi:hypothetical protein